ncbi:MAG: hypothetical protein KAH56_03470 [Candidatus Krumholzibacteria bacterium]|nr:hypothetical protein [Candidatus Krumholzibacteria bacterium]
MSLQEQPIQQKGKPGFSDRFVSLVLLSFFTLSCGLHNPAGAQLTEGNSRLSLPQSQLGQPFENPVFLTGHWAFGGGFQDQHGDQGYGGALIFRPGSPVNIFDGFMNWKTGMVVQVDYLKIPDGGDITSADLILRRYFNNRGDREVEVNIFLGLGSGISDIDRSDPDDVAAGEHWSILAEAGQEWFFKPTHMLFLKAQYRWMINAGRTWRTWSVMVGAGIAWP